MLKIPLGWWAAAVQPRQVVYTSRNFQPKHTLLVVALLCIRSVCEAPYAEHRAINEGVRRPLEQLTYPNEQTSTHMRAVRLSVRVRPPVRPIVLPSVLPSSFYIPLEPRRRRRRLPPRSPPRSPARPSVRPSDRTWSVARHDRSLRSSGGGLGLHRRRLRGRRSRGLSLGTDRKIAAAAVVFQCK